LNWSAKAEYLFVELGNGSCTTDCALQNPGGLGPNPLEAPTIPIVAVKFDESVIRAGINYKFGS
jgi:hypothetical protein